MLTKVLNFKLMFRNLYRADNLLKKPNNIQNGNLSSYGEITKKKPTKEASNKLNSILPKSIAKIWKLSYKDPTMKNIL